MVSATEADWGREKLRGFWCPGRKLLKSIRDYQRYRAKDNIMATMLSKTCVIRHMFWSVVSGADIPLNAIIGGGLSIPHPNGIVIHPTAQIGVNCLIHQQVTLGIKRSGNKGPVIAGHVDIGAGAKIIGHVTIGQHALIGANAVVTKDVEPYDIVAGIPARKIGTTFRNES